MYWKSMIMLIPYKTRLKLQPGINEFLTIVVANAVILNSNYMKIEQECMFMPKSYGKSRILLPETSFINCAALIFKTMRK